MNKRIRFILQNKKDIKIKHKEDLKKKNNKVDANTNGPFEELLSRSEGSMSQDQMIVNFDEYIRDFANGISPREDVRSASYLYEDDSADSDVAWGPGYEQFRMGVIE